jgi:hypothetical protein
MATKSLAVNLPIEFSVTAPENATAAELMRAMAGALAQVAKTLDAASAHLESQNQGNREEAPV